MLPNGKLVAKHEVRCGSQTTSSLCNADQVLQPLFFATLKQHGLFPGNISVRIPPNHLTPQPLALTDCLRVFVNPFLSLSLSFFWLKKLIRFSFNRCECNEYFNAVNRLYAHVSNLKLLNFILFLSNHEAVLCFSY